MLFNYGFKHVIALSCLNRAGTIIAQAHHNTTKQIYISTSLQPLFAWFFVQTYTFTILHSQFIYYDLEYFFKLHYLSDKS